MKFTDYLNDKNLDEAVRLTIDNPGKWARTPGELLRLYHDKFGSESFAMKDTKDIKKAFADSRSNFAIGEFLAKKGYIQRNGNDLKITKQGLDYISGSKGSKTTKVDDEDEDVSIAKGVKDASRLKQKKFIVPKVGKNSKYLDQMKTILTHMKGFAAGSDKTTFMLGGDPGTGKTSFIKSLSTLTGIPLVIIEAPHITQEHLINIPFLVIDGNKTKSGNLSIDDSQNSLKVVQAESNLVTQLKSKRKRTPDQIQREIQKNKVLRDIYPMVERRISKIAGSYNSILFLDEFYRTSSVKIRNVLRNILNGKIGNDQIPKGVYIVMATNLNDDGVDEIPLNQDFHLIDYDVSSKDDFMSYMYGQYIDAREDEEDYDDTVPNTDIVTPTGVSIKPEVWNKFMNELGDADLGFNDEESDVRLSPRRLEQIILYVDAALPVRSVEEANNLMSFIKTNFTNYVDDNLSINIAAKFSKIVIDLMMETKGDLELNVEKLVNNPSKRSNWRSQLQHQIEMKIKLGENRKYVPVVSGAPGIGKTTQMVDMSHDMSMGFIQVDVSNLAPEDITGMPIANMGGDEITTEFSEPNLYITIMKEYNKKIERYRQEGRKYNMILLFDELNRASIPVFNSIRKVLLEREFENVKLPDDIIITGAINPSDIGAIEFTSHTRDVLDIISSSGNFAKTMEYIRTKEELLKISDGMGFDLLGSVASIMGQLANDFKSTKDSEGNDVEDLDEQPFWWSDGSSVFYVSPREMTSCVAASVNQIEDAFDDMNWNVDSQYDESEYDAFINEALNVTAKSFVNTFNMITLKQEIEGFTNTLAMKIVGNEKFKKIFESIRTKKSSNQLSLFDILKNVNGDVSFLDKGVIGEYIKDSSSTEMMQDIAVISADIINNLNGLESIEKHIDLYVRLSKSLERLNASNNYNDQAKRYLGGTIANILRSGSVNMLDFAENDALVKKLEAFN